MLLGLDSEEKKLKTALEVTGADMVFVKNWLKLYERTKKSAAYVVKSYYAARNSLVELQENLRILEKLVIGFPVLALEQKKLFRELIRDMKKLQGNAGNEFLISREDRDFHTTLESVVKLSEQYIFGECDGIIFRSEIENLIDLTDEGMQREKPDLFALGYFYLNRTDEELSGMTMAEKKAKIERVFYQEFALEMIEQMSQCIQRADGMWEKYHTDHSRKMNHLMEDIAPLMIQHNKGNVLEETSQNPDTRAKAILDKMCRL